MVYDLGHESRGTYNNIVKLFGPSIDQDQHLRHIIVEHTIVTKVGGGERKLIGAYAVYINRELIGVSYALIEIDDSEPETESKIVMD